MFKKESKEYANKWLESIKNLELQHKTDDKPEYIRILEAHQKGAEFGYNKAREELLEQAKKYITETASGTAEEMFNIEQFYITGLLDGYAKGKAVVADFNKANEWHYVKDGDLPKEENLECLCIIRPMKEEGEPFESKDFRGVLYFRNERFYLDEDNGNDCLKETNSDFTNLVIAWKEIVLPGLKESEK